MFEVVSTVKNARYVYARTAPEHPRANENGLYPVHRVKMENKLGRLLGQDEVVHHRNGDRTDNSIENLEVMTRAEHTSHHKEGEGPITCVCGWCGCEFEVEPRYYRQRAERNSSGKVFCSRSCGAKHQHNIAA